MAKSRDFNYHVHLSCAVRFPATQACTAKTIRKRNPMTAESSAEHRAPLTIVTAFFAIENRHRNRSARDYYAWMARFLPFIRWPMVVYCDAQSIDVIKRMRGRKPTLYRVTDLREFSVYRHRDTIIAHNEHHRLNYHADVCMVWHEKANFMRRAIDENPFASEMFFWCDISLLRPHKTRTWFRLSERIEWPNWQVCRSTFADQVTFFSRMSAAIAPPPPATRAESWADFGAARAAQLVNFATITIAS